MSKNSVKKPDPKSKVERPSQPVAPEPPVLKIILAIIGSLGAIIAAYLAATKPVILTIDATQTAEFRLTAIAMTATEGAFQTQTQAANISMTAFSGTQTALAIEAEKESLAVSASQTALAIEAEKENLSVSASQTSEAQVFETQTAIALAIPAATENKPIRIEYIFSKGDTLEGISKKFIGSGLYASAIGRANCKPTPLEGNALVIRFYSAQQGDSIELLAYRFSSSPDFLRAINAIDTGITSLPTDQILILPGKCGN